MEQKEVLELQVSLDLTPESWWASWNFLVALEVLLGKHWGPGCK